MFEVSQRLQGPRRQLEKVLPTRFDYPGSEYHDWVNRGGARLKAAFPDIDIIGIGSESVVVRNPGNPEQVITMGFDKRERRGVSPFATTYHLHQLLNLIYPSDFVDVHSVSGISPRTAVKDLVVGDPLRDGDYLSVDAREHEISAELAIAGLDIGIDPYDTNYIHERGAWRNIDFVEPCWHDADFHPSYGELAKIFENNNHELVASVKKARLTAIRHHLTRLKELTIVNVVFQSMVDSHNFEIDTHRIMEELSLSDLQQSLPRITLLLERAVNAVKTKGYRYNRRWLV